MSSEAIKVKLSPGTGPMAEAAGKTVKQVWLKKDNIERGIGFIFEEIPGERPLGIFLQARIQEENDGASVAKIWTEWSMIRDNFEAVDHGKLSKFVGLYLVQTTNIKYGFCPESQLVFSKDVAGDPCMVLRIKPKLKLVGLNISTPEMATLNGIKPVLQIDLS